MAITREKKKQLVEQYAAGLKVATNAVVLQQNGITFKDLLFLLLQMVIMNLVLSRR